MKVLLALLLLSPLASLAQSPFDATWVIDAKTMELPQKPAVYFLVNGMFRCSDCNGANIEIKTDGQDHKVGETGYWDTVNVRVLDAYTVEIVSKKAGKTIRIGSTITYKCMAEGFSAKTPLGEKFDAKFDGKDYEVEDDPARTMVSVKLLSPNRVEQTNKRDGKVVGVLRLTVAPGGETIHATYENREANTTTTYTMLKQPQ
jgi:hypothetical protein